MDKHTLDTASSSSFPKTSFFKILHGFYAIMLKSELTIIQKKQKKEMKAFLLGVI